MPTPKKTAQKKESPKGTAQPILNQSHYDLFRGRLTFTNEPTWLRIVLVVMVLTAPIVLFLLLHHYALPVLGIRWMSNASWIKGVWHGKSRSPRDGTDP